MRREGLDRYDDIPRGMKAYLKNYGLHFNKKAAEYATGLMRKRNPQTGQPEKVRPYTKEEVDDLLRQYGVTLENDILYDKVYVATRCKADCLGSSVVDEAHLAMNVKDVLDDIDANDGVVFNGWYAEMVRNGMPIEWEDLI